MGFACVLCIDPFLGAKLGSEDDCDVGMVLGYALAGVVLNSKLPSWAKLCGESDNAL